jgi:hypothetical protein
VAIYRDQHTPPHRHICCGDISRRHRTSDVISTSNVHTNGGVCTPPPVIMVAKNRNVHHRGRRRTSQLFTRELGGLTHAPCASQLFTIDPSGLTHAPRTSSDAFARTSIARPQTDLRVLRHFCANAPCANAPCASPNGFARPETVLHARALRIIKRICAHVPCASLNGFARTRLAPHQTVLRACALRIIKQICAHAPCSSSNGFARTRLEHCSQPSHDCAHSCGQVRRLVGVGSLFHPAQRGDDW